MVDTRKLIALLEVDGSSEYLVEQLSRVLVDERKRELLLIKLREIDEDMDILKESGLTKNEGEVLRIAQEARKPMTAAEVQERVGDRFTSLRRYRHHASAVLNSLTDKGLLGKVSSKDRATYFAPTWTAVKLALIHLGQMAEECDLQRVREITGLPFSAIQETIEGMKTQ